TVVAGYLNPHVRDTCIRRGIDSLDDQHPGAVRRHRLAWSMHAAGRGQEEKSQSDQRSFHESPRSEKCSTAKLPACFRRRQELLEKTQKSPPLGRAFRSVYWP